jgi:hypothetical protein
MKGNGRLLRATIVLNYPRIYRGEPVFGDESLYNDIIGMARRYASDTEIDVIRRIRKIPLDRKLPSGIADKLGKYFESCEYFAQNVIKKMDVEDAESKIYRYFKIS